MSTVATDFFIAKTSTNGLKEAFHFPHIVKFKLPSIKLESFVNL